MTITAGFDPGKAQRSQFCPPRRPDASRRGGIFYGHRVGCPFWEFELWNVALVCRTLASTLANALTAAGIEAANYPFCTIEPNVGIVDPHPPAGSH